MYMSNLWQVLEAYFKHKVVLASILVPIILGFNILLVNILFYPL